MSDTINVLNSGSYPKPIVDFTHLPQNEYFHKHKLVCKTRQVTLSLSFETNRDQHDVKFVFPDRDRTDLLYMLHDEDDPLTKEILQFVLNRYADADPKLRSELLLQGYPYMSHRTSVIRHMFMLKRSDLILFLLQEGVIPLTPDMWSWLLNEYVCFPVLRFALTQGYVVDGDCLESMVFLILRTGDEDRQEAIECFTYLLESFPSISSLSLFRLFLIIMISDQLMMVPSSTEKEEELLPTRKQLFDQLQARYDVDVAALVSNAWDPVCPWNETLSLLQVLLGFHWDRSTRYFIQYLLDRYFLDSSTLGRVNEEGRTELEELLHGLKQGRLFARGDFSYYAAELVQWEHDVTTSLVSRETITRKM